MNIPDPVTTGVALAGALQIAKQGQEFIAAAFGHPGESIGTMLGNIGRRRIQNAEAVGNKAHFILLDIGVTPQEAALDVIQPLLEGASLQEEPNLQDAWANLLANATDPRKQNPVSAAFPGVLQDLGPREAKFLNSVYLNSVERLSSNPPWKGPGDAVHSTETLRDLYYKAGLSTRRLAFLNVGDGADNPEELQLQQREFRMTIDVLERHNLIQRIVTMTGHAGFDGGTNKLGEIFRLTAFGSAFIKACRPPSK